MFRRFSPVPLLSVGWLLLTAITQSYAAEPGPANPRENIGPLVIHVNQVAYDRNGLKSALVESGEWLPSSTAFQVVPAAGTNVVFAGKLAGAEECPTWFSGRNFYRADFSKFAGEGTFRVQVIHQGATIRSAAFEVGQNALVHRTIPAIIGYFQHQRANTKEELEADSHLLLFGSTNRVDLRGGWGDASGDISKYFSHLAYANFMSPQQTPQVVWSMVNAVDKAGHLLERIDAKASLQAEALYGADYVRRSLAPAGYFYMTIFSYFKKDPEARRVVGLLADSKTTSDYQCAYREGGGMAIAALARISRWKRDGEFTSAQYLEGAERAFAHLQTNNLKYCDDGKENIIDDYCALLAATELWITTGKELYRDAARLRAGNLNRRMSSQGYFIADDGQRPFWHAADAGLPVIALARYLDQEKDKELRKAALATVKQALDYHLRVTANAANPFGYARQTFRHGGQVQDGFFIPHENETGWWWQGENARLASLATAAIVGSRLIFPAKDPRYVVPKFEQFAHDQINWILGQNPYDMCFMYGFGQHNVPYMAALFGHGSGKGGISNGITGQDGNGDGSGIDFKLHANGNEWRWTEQWIPHAGWFLQAMTAMSTE